MKNSILLLILLFIILLIILNFKKNIENFSNNNFSDYYRFVRDLSKYKKKKYELIFTSGPTLNEFEKNYFSNEIYENSYIISIKNSINFLDKIGIRPDFLLSNSCSSANRINKDLINKYNTINIAISTKKNLDYIKKHFKYLVKLINKKKKI